MTTDRYGPEPGSPVAGEFDVLVVGAGFAGLYSLYRLRELGYSVQVLEQADGVGGTWYWNCYPGARCDVESMEYSYSFSADLEQEWEWSERYPTQPEILRYINHVADRFDLRRNIRFGARVTEASYDEASEHWVLTIENGERFIGRYFIAASGCLSSRLEPTFSGIETFRGNWYHTAAWPRNGVDFSGKRVGVIGTGSTGIQLIPQIARQAGHLHVFQRTPNFSVPAQNGPLSEEFQRDMKARYRAHRAAARQSAFGVPVAANPRSALEVSDEEARTELDARWEYGGGATMMLSFADLLSDERANEIAAEYVRRKIRGIVRDQGTAAMLCPHDHPLGTKRICVDINYYDTYNRANVTLVDVRSAPVAEIMPTGMRLADGREFELDAIVFAIGFDAMTGALRDMNLRGRDRILLEEKWAGGPRTNLGLTTTGFPNLFIITGPGSPSVLSNMVVSIEQHVDWIADLLEYMRARGYSTVEPTGQAEDRWVEHCTEIGNATLFPRAKSWYTGQNVPGKPFVFMPYVGGVGPYRRACEKIAADGYPGFSFDGAPVAVQDQDEQLPHHVASVGSDTSP